MRICLLLCLLLLAACHATPPPATDAPETGWQPILTQNRRFVYTARWYAPGATAATLDTVVMTAQGKQWLADSTQTAFEWSYRHPDTTATSAPKEIVGAYDRPNKFWLHPPRRNHYRILELNPFPDIELPVKFGRKWDLTLYPPDLYADSAWATWTGTMRVDYQYQVVDSTLLPTPLGRLPCYRVQATGSCKLGATTLESYFNPRYGFVRLNYGNIDRSRLELKLVRVTSRPVLDQAIFSAQIQ